MSSSILQKHKECYVTGVTYGLHKHHIFQNALRTMAERMGFWVWLDGRIHMMAHERRPPFNTLIYELRAKCQQEYEKTHSHEDWMKLVHRDYSEWF